MRDGHEGRFSTALSLPLFVVKNASNLTAVGVERVLSFFERVFGWDDLPHFLLSDHESAMSDFLSLLPE